MHWPVKKPAVPLSKHQAQHLVKKEVFGFLAAAGHHGPERGGRRARAAHVNGGPRIPGGVGQGQQQQLPTNK